MVCFRLSKKNFLKLTLSLLTAFIILLGGIGHADASYSTNYPISVASSTLIDLSSFCPTPSLSTNIHWFSYSSAKTSDAEVIASQNTLGQGRACYSEETQILDLDNTVGAGDIAITYLYYTLDQNNLWPSGSQTVYGYSNFSRTDEVWTGQDIYGCMDNMAVNYDPTATVSSGCYYVLPNETATSTRIISFTYSTTTSKLDLTYYIATSSSVQLYAENRNERDGVINSAFSTTTTGLTELKNIPVTLPDPLNGAGYTYLTAKLVLESDHGVIYDWHTLTVDLYNGVDLGGGGYQQEECGITHLGGCFMNGLAVMFYPSQGAFNNFNTFIELIKTKPPVGYFYVVKNNLDNLNSTTTSAFTVTIPAHIKQYLFTPFDVAIGGILWFYFAMNFYKRLKHITV
jgi:hypothetical protein